MVEFNSQITTIVQSLTNLHHQAIQVNDPTAKAILSDLTHWNVELLRLLTQTMEQFSQKFSTNENIINTEFKSIKLEITQERDQRLHRNLGKSIYTVISNILGMEEKILRESLMQQILTLSNERLIQQCTKQLEEGKYNKTILYLICQKFEKFLLIYHAKKKQITYMGDKNMAALPIYERNGQFLLLKRKQKEQHSQVKIQIKDQKVKEETSQKSQQLTKQPLKQDRKQQLNGKKNLKDQLQIQNEKKKLKRLASESEEQQYSESEEIELCCKICQAGPFKSETGLMVHQQRKHNKNEKQQKHKGGK